MKHARIMGRLLAVLAVVLACLATPMAFMTTPASAAAVAQYTNPLVEQRADSQIYRHTDGYYYFTATVPEYDRIILRRSTTLQGLSSAAEKVIWTRHARGDMSSHIWAPEIHYIDGRWYVYFAAGSDDIWKIRMYALEAAGDNPLDATWNEKGQIATPVDSFSLDASTFVHNDVRYLIWAQSAPPVDGTNIYIATMRDPWTIDQSTVTMLSAPTLSWERVGHNVNEGPTVLERNGRVFLTYSASATDANYCLGMLTAAATSDLLDPASWTKSPNPVFKSSDATGQYGPGHNSFTVSEDGEADILVYHDRNYKNITGDPLNDPNRRTRIQQVYWNADGTPNFGIPVPDGATPVRIRSLAHPDQYVRHYEYRARLEADITNLADSEFKVVPGLADPAAVSFESTNFPGLYLRHSNFELWLRRNDGTTGFSNDATFIPRTGLADQAQLSFESLNFPGRYLRNVGGLMYVYPVTDEAGRGDATFVLDPAVPVIVTGPSTGATSSPDPVVGRGDTTDGFGSL